MCVAGNGVNVVTDDDNDDGAVVDDDDMRTWPSATDSRLHTDTIWQAKATTDRGRTGRIDREANVNRDKGGRDGGRRFQWKLGLTCINIL